MCSFYPVCDFGCVCGDQRFNEIGFDGMRELAPALCQLTLLKELYLVRFRNVFSMCVWLLDYLVLCCLFALCLFPNLHFG